MRLGVRNATDANFSLRKSNVAHIFKADRKHDKDAFSENTKEEKRHRASKIMIGSGTTGRRAGFFDPSAYAGTSTNDLRGRHTLRGKS
jgi:hypothetical protein